uniref:Uncharacterized protein n=1 Tax=Nelumbo nucifera TaxID=4432 RepID=A0A822XKM3_NELNU|nr:TPA_asm: hypothetical protein HUJ06_020828 [Nelumbo nucifera]
MNNDKNKYKYNTSAFIKVQIPDVSHIPSLLEKKTSQTAIILGSNLAALFFVFIVVCILIILYRKKNDEEKYEEDALHRVPGMPRRFSYQDLKMQQRIFVRSLDKEGLDRFFMGLSKWHKSCSEVFGWFGSSQGIVKSSFDAGSMHTMKLFLLPNQVLSSCRFLPLNSKVMGKGWYWYYQHSHHFRSCRQSCMSRASFFSTSL